MTVELFVDILTILICILQSVGYTSNALIKGSQNNSNLDSDDTDPNHEHLLALIKSLVGNFTALMILSFTETSNVLLKNIRFGLTILAVLGFIWSFISLIYYRISHMETYKSFAERIIKNFKEQYCDFMAQVIEVREGEGIVLKNVYIRDKESNSWFPYCYPCCQDETLQLRTSMISDNIYVDGWISFSAIAHMKESTFLLEACDNLQVISYEQPKPLQGAQLYETWSRTEQLVCKSCKFLDSCHSKHFPCAVLNTCSCKWTRNFLAEQYPALIENRVDRFAEKLKDGPYLNVLFKSVARKDAKELGFRSASVIIIANPTNGSLLPGARIVAIDGKKVKRGQQVRKILAKHNPGDNVIVTTSFPKHSATEHSVTLIGRQQAAKIMFMSYPSFYNTDSKSEG